MTFQSHCQSLGIKLLKDDIIFIKSQLAIIPHAKHRDALSRYANTWMTAMESCDKVIRKMNAGRFAANTELREYTCKVP